MLTIEQTVHMDWINFCESLIRLYQLRLEQSAESFGLKPMTWEQIKDTHPCQAIPTETDMVFLLPDPFSVVPQVDESALNEILEHYPKDDSMALVQRLLTVYESAPHLFESEVQGIMSDVRLKVLKGLNSYCKMAGSHLGKLETLRRNSTPLPKQVHEPLDAAISNMAESVRYATAMKVYLETLPTPPGMTSKGDQRKNQTAVPEWSSPVLDTVRFFINHGHGINDVSACKLAAQTLQAIFPAQWSGPIELLTARINQRLQKANNPL